MSIYKKRVNYKPFEYPEVMTFVDSINNTFWTHSEVKFTADVHDFLVNLNDTEREVVKRSLLGISQVEVCVKSFWGDLYKHFPKPEFNILGSTFAHNESIHSESYSRLLTVLGLEEEFSKLFENKIFRDKFELIEKNLNSKLSIIEKLLFFAIVIENASLFSQFANILSFTRFKSNLKNVSNIIAWTVNDEDIHANAGIYILNILRSEGHLTPEIENNLYASITEYMQYEEKLLDWVYEKGELSFFTKENMLDFMKYRVDNALVKMGMKKLYNISNEKLKPMAWFEEEVYANAVDDFFAKRPVDYTKNDKSFTAEDLF